MEEGGTESNSVCLEHPCGDREVVRDVACDTCGDPSGGAFQAMPRSLDLILGAVWGPGKDPGEQWLGQSFVLQHSFYRVSQLFFPRQGTQT